MEMIILSLSRQYITTLKLHNHDHHFQYTYPQDNQNSQMDQTLNHVQVSNIHLDKHSKYHHHEH